MTRQMFDVLEEGQIVQSLFEAPDGALWAASSGSLVSLHNGARKAFDVENRIWSSISVVGADQKGQVWAGGRASVSAGRTSRYVGPMFELHSDTLRPVADAGISGTVSAIYFDRSGRLWVGTQVGLAFRDNSGWKFLTARDGITGHSVDAIAEDSKDAIWIGTEGGGLSSLFQRQKCIT